MDVGICGFGYSGSGAFFDLLKEYEELDCSAASEMFITYFPDGLCDLYHHTCEYHSKFFNSDVAIRRFLALCKEYGKIFGWSKQKKEEFYRLSLNFINQITQCQYRGIWAQTNFTMNELEKSYYYRFGSRVNRLFKKELVGPTRTIYFSYNPKNFIEQAKAYITQIKKICGYNTKKNCVLNQPFAADNPEASFPFFSNPKAIIVRRDPRDTYIMVKHFIKRDASWIPYKNVKEFISFYKAQCQNAHSRENVLVVNFEDLIYKYEQTKKVIENFLSISNHVTKYEFFDPKKSVNNTRLYEKITDYREDIKKIENELPEFLYDFSKVKYLDNNGQCFWD